MDHDDFAARIDGLSNVLTGLGFSGADPQIDTQRTYAYLPNVYALEQEFIQSWPAQREVSQLPWDMFRRGFEIIGLDAEQFDLKKIRSWIEGDQTVLPDGQISDTPGLLWWAWQLREKGDLLAGAALFPVLDDGLDPIEPLDVRRIRRVVRWELFDREELTPWWLNLGVNTEPQYYVLSDVLTRDGDLRPGDIIHTSRLIIHRGIELSRREMRNRGWWGASVLEKNRDQRRAIEAGVKYANSYLDRASWLHLSMAELQELLQATDENGNNIGEEAVRKRLQTLRLFARSLGIAVSDGGREGYLAPGSAQAIPGRKPDKLESIVEKIGDADKIINLNLDQWGYGTGMPRSKAFGEGANGMRGGDNKGDRQDWAGNVNAQQTFWGTRVLNRMLIIEFASKTGPTGGVIPDDWTIKWNSLEIPTPLEQAQIDKARAEADNTRIDKGVAKPGEVRLQRLVQGDDDGPLRASDDVGDENAVGPAQVGIATAALEGMIAVSKGELEPEALAKWLTSIDESRYPPEEALAIARSALRQGSSFAPATEADGSGSGKVPANVLLGAGTSVGKGEMDPHFLAAALPVLDPEVYDLATASALAEAAAGGPADVEPPDAGVPVPAVSPGEAATGDAEPEPDDEVELAYSTDPMPNDLRSPKVLAQELTEALGFELKAQAIHATARRSGLRVWRFNGKPAYSRREIRRAYAEENGMLPKQADEDIDASEP